MLQLFGAKSVIEGNFKPQELDCILSKLTQIYRIEEISEDRKQYLTKTIQKYGYLPYPQFKVLQELTDSETIFCLIEKLKYAGTFKDSKILDFKNPSVLSRLGITNSSWFKKETHNIKLIALSALGDGNSKDCAGHFIDWIKCLITLSSGCALNKVLPDTLYLIPFTKREFDCAYLPKSSEVSEKLCDDNILKFLGLDTQAQVKLFIELAQLCNHPVIYDILPQTARFSKIVLSKPEIARWIDVKELIDSINEYVGSLCNKLILKKAFDEQDIIEARKLYSENLKGLGKKYPEKIQKIVDVFENELKEYRILISYQMSFSKKQQELVKRVNEVISKTSNCQIKQEDDIKNQDEITNALIKEGLWTNPGGAWCSAGVPVFIGMVKGAKYPLFKHYNYKGEDVTHFANLDCQTPYYFYRFEQHKYNWDVVDFYVNYIEKLRDEYNFDGFRVDHIDHIVDSVSQNSKKEPISYRIPARVLYKINANIKKKIPYFATLAEYMLWDGYYKEYHKDMKFDLLWGDDIVSQSTKTPKQIIKDNLKLACYNQEASRLNPLSILKGYNNQDGEFRDINQYPGQLGFQGALFKWFKMKFIPGGRYANRPTLYIDGDESFTKTGIERIISKETSMVRELDWDFWEKFNALNYFAQHDELINNGKAHLYSQDENGFVCWEIMPERSNKNLNIDYSYLVVANYFSPTELKDVKDSNGKTQKKVVKGTITKNNTVALDNSRIVSYFDFELDEMNKLMFIEKPMQEEITKSITFNELRPAEFKVYKLKD